MTKMRRIFYVGMVNSEQLARHVAIELFIGAGARKMGNINRALRAAGEKSWIIALPTLGPSAPMYRTQTYIQTDRRNPGVFLGVARNRWIRKIRCSFSLFWFLATKTRKVDRVIFYNAEFEYIFAAIWLFVRRNRPLLDVEDTPTSESSLRARARKIFFRGFLRLCQPRIITVSTQVATDLGAQSCFVVYGTFDEALALQAIKHVTKWDELELGGELRIHYGGTLIDETGLALFCEAVELLARGRTTAERPIRIIVTSHNVPHEILALQKLDSSPTLNVEYHSLSSREDMIDILLSCHASLSLKLSTSELSVTTFPSKVIEICSAGVLLITTCASDVPILFDNTNSLILREETPDSLSQAIDFVHNNPKDAKSRAQAGQTFVRQKFSCSKVGADLAAFIVVPTSSNEHIGRP